MPSSGGIGDLVELLLHARLQLVGHRRSNLVPTGRHAANGSRPFSSLAAMRPASCERILGIAEVDLFVPDLNFVFGVADEARGAALFSLARLVAPRDPQRALRRSATEAVHELGHAYGLGHCEDPRCAMWFSNTLAETDRKGPRLCGRDADALRRATA